MRGVADGVVRRLPPTPANIESSESRLVALNRGCFCSFPVKVERTSFSIAASSSYLAVPVAARSPLPRVALRRAADGGAGEGRALSGEKGLSLPSIPLKDGPLTSILIGPVWPCRPNSSCLCRSEGNLSDTGRMPVLGTSALSAARLSSTREYTQRSTGRGLPYAPTATMLSQGWKATHATSTPKPRFSPPFTFGFPVWASNMLSLPSAPPESTRPPSGDTTAPCILFSCDRDALLPPAVYDCSTTPSPSFPTGLSAVFLDGSFRLIVIAAPDGLATSTRLWLCGYTSSERMEDIP
mmetsp:Transcript_39554/g.101570  ORF Transcript_39554/g.101570 Transcript_39554/m.101570 type:complete len:296 (+) Transcript_39554:375-1262(+)